MSKNIVKLDEVYRKVLNKDLSSTEELQGSVFYKIIDSAGYFDYNQWLEYTEFDESDMAELSAILIYNDALCESIARKLVSICSNYYQWVILPKFLYDIWNEVNDNYDYRWARVWFEKIYYDLFHKEKAFRYDLLKYLQRDGETVVLPDIKGGTFSSKTSE